MLFRAYSEKMLQSSYALLEMQQWGGAGGKKAKGSVNLVFRRNPVAPHRDDPPCRVGVRARA